LETAKELDCSYNDISYVGIKSFLQQAYLQCEDPCRLEILNFEGNSLGDKTVKALFRALADSIYLRELNVAKNNMTEKSLEALGYLLHQTTGLKKLNLHWNSIKGAHACYLLGDYLSKNKTLSIVDLSWNSLGST